MNQQTQPQSHYALGPLLPNILVFTPDRFDGDYLKKLSEDECVTRKQVTELLSRHITSMHVTHMHGNEPPVSCYLYDKQTGECNPINNDHYNPKTLIVKESPLFHCIHKRTGPNPLPYIILRHGIIDAALVVLDVTRSGKKEEPLPTYHQPLSHFIHIFNLLPQYRNVNPGVLELIEISSFLNDTSAITQVIKTIELHGVYYPIWGHVSPISVILQTLFDYQTMTKKLNSSAPGLLETNSFVQVFHPFTTMNSTLITYGIYIMYLSSSLAKWLVEGDKDQEMPYYAFDIVENNNTNHGSNNNSSSVVGYKLVLTYCPIQKSQLKNRIAQIRSVFRYSELSILNFSTEFIINFMIPTHKNLLYVLDETLLSLGWTNNAATGTNDDKPPILKVFTSIRVILADLIQKGTLTQSMIKEFIKDARNLQKETATRLMHAHEICILKLSGVERYYTSPAEEANAHASRETLVWFENGPFTIDTTQSSDGGDISTELAKAHYLNKQPTSWLQMLYPITSETMPLLFESTSRDKKKNSKGDSSMMEIDSDHALETTNTSSLSDGSTTSPLINNSWDLGICSLTDPELIPRPSLRILSKNHYNKDNEYNLSCKTFYRGKIEKLFFAIETLCQDITNLLQQQNNTPSNGLPRVIMDKIEQTHKWIPLLRSEVRTLKDLVASQAVTDIINDHTQSLAKLESLTNTKEDIIDLIWYYIYVFSIKFTEELNDIIQMNLKKKEEVNNHTQQPLQ